jgi:hypothetical protein
MAPAVNAGKGVFSKNTNSSMSMEKWRVAKGTDGVKAFFWRQIQCRFEFALDLPVMLDRDF